MKKIIIFIVITLMASTFSITASAQSRASWTTIRQVFVDSDAYGHCMVLLGKRVNSRCGTWVTFSCDGRYNPSVIGYQKLEIAKSIVGTGMRAYVSVDSSRRINNHCYASRIDIRSTK